MASIMTKKDLKGYTQNNVTPSQGKNAPQLGGFFTLDSRVAPECGAHKNPMPEDKSLSCNQSLRYATSFDHQVPNTQVVRSADTTSNVENMLLQCDSYKNVASFIAKLYDLLENHDNRKYLKWNDTGDVFMVFYADEFAETVLPRYFKHSKFASFVRQLNIYGFYRVTDARKSIHVRNKEACVFSHNMFLRGRRELLPKIKRRVPRKASLSFKTGRSQLPQAESANTELHDQNTKIEYQIQGGRYCQQKPSSYSYPRLAQNEPTNDDVVIGTSGEYLLSYQDAPQQPYSSAQLPNDYLAHFGKEYPQKYYCPQNLLQRPEESTFAQGGHARLSSAGEIPSRQRQNITTHYGTEEWTGHDAWDVGLYRNYAMYLPDHKNFSGSLKRQPSVCSDGQQCYKTSDICGSAQKDDTGYVLEKPVHDHIGRSLSVDRCYSGSGVHRGAGFATRSHSWTHPLQNMPFGKISSHEEANWLLQRTANQPQDSNAYNVLQSDIPGTKPESNPKLEQSLGFTEASSSAPTGNKQSRNNTAASSEYPTPPIIDEVAYSTQESAPEYNSMAEYGCGIYLRQAQPQQGVSYSSTTHNTDQICPAPQRSVPSSAISNPLHCPLSGIDYESHIANSSGYIANILSSTSLW